MLETQSNQTMVKRFIFLLAGVLLLPLMSWLIAAALPSSSAAAAPEAVTFSLTAFASGLNEPVSLAHAGDSRLFALEQVGRIRIIQSDGTVLATPFLDITDRVDRSDNEEGLLGLAFHPNYSSNGYFYVNYINTTSGVRRTRISRFQVTGNPNVANPASEQIILTVGQHNWNHNAGDIHFGPDGYLYIPLGDGGGSGDTGNYAQTMTTLLGKIVRIDVNQGPGAAPDCVGIGTGSYTIPNDNPFINGAGGTCDEIWASGLRNPWRSSFDAWTGDFWMGDVGQGSWEEIDFQPVYSQGGENYGWRCYEGNNPYNTSGCGPASNYVFPVFAYSRSSPQCSVTGGYVYRGSQYPALFGRYVLTDFCSGHFWDIAPDGQGGWTGTQHPSTPVSGRAAFGQNVDGALFVANRATGTVQRLVEGTPSSPALFVTMSGPSTANAGAPIVYTLTVTNTGNAAATSLVVRDWVPAGATYVSGGSHSGGVVSWNIPNLAAGGSTSVQYTVNANQTITNTRYGVTSNQVNANGSGAVVTTIQQVQQPILSITKTGPGSAQPSQLITYTLTVNNTGTGDAHNLIISDTVPTGATYITGGSYAAGVVTWTSPHLAAQGSLQVQFVVTATQTIINDTYSVTSDQTSAVGTTPVTTIIGGIDVYMPLTLRD